MFKLGKLTDYGTVLMTTLALEPGVLRTAHELAEHTHLATPTVAKLLKLLSKASLVESERGAHGGYRLARPPASISVADIICALEGPIALTECADHHGCGIESHCGVRSHWQVINHAVRSALEAVSLEQMSLPARSSLARPASGPHKDIPIHFTPLTRMSS